MGCLYRGKSGDMLFQRPYEAAKYSFKMHFRMKKQNYVPVTNAITNSS